MEDILGVDWETLGVYLCRHCPEEYREPDTGYLDCITGHNYFDYKCPKFMTAQNVQNIIDRAIAEIIKEVL